MFLSDKYIIVWNRARFNLWKSDKTAIRTFLNSLSDGCVNKPPMFLSDNIARDRARFNLWWSFKAHMSNKNALLMIMFHFLNLINTCCWVQTASIAGQVIIVGGRWTTAIGDTHQPAASWKLQAVTDWSCGYWAIQLSWFARVHALCNLSRKMSREVGAHWVGVASRCV